MQKLVFNNRQYDVSDFPEEAKVLLQKIVESEREIDRLRTLAGAISTARIALARELNDIIEQDENIREVDFLSEEIGDTLSFD